jgi:acyl carrier protein
VLGRDRQSPIDPDQGFLDLGFDSLTALGFRNKLDAITGLRLPATLIFDYPSPVALVAWLRSQVVGGESAAQTSLAALEATLRSAIPTDQERAAIAARLRTLAAAWSEERQPVAGPEQDLGAVSVEELFGILDGELETQ